MVVNYNIMILSMVQYLLVQDKQEIKAGTKLAEWDPTSKVLLTEKAGNVKFVDFIENITVQERFDEATNKSIVLFLNIKSEKYQPALSIVDDEGNEELHHYFLPAGSYLDVAEKQAVDSW